MRCACVCIITLLLCYGLSCSIDKHRASIYKWFLFFEVMAIELHIDYNAMKYIYIVCFIDDDLLDRCDSRAGARRRQPVKWHRLGSTWILREHTLRVRLKSGYVVLSIQQIKIIQRLVKRMYTVHYCTSSDQWRTMQRGTSVEHSWEVDYVKSGGLPGYLNTIADRYFSPTNPCAHLSPHWRPFLSFY